MYFAKVSVHFLKGSLGDVTWVTSMPSMRALGSELS